MRWVAAVGAACAAGSGNAHADFIALDDTASMGLYLTNVFQVSQSVSSNGEASIHRGPQWNSLGTSIFGGLGEVLARWDEHEDATGDYLRAEWKQSDGQQLFPGNSEVDHEPAIFWNWRMGAVDPVAFADGETIPVLQAVLSMSRDGGNTFFETRDITWNYRGLWNGTDLGARQSNVGAGINFLRVDYYFRLLPAPGTLGGMGVAGLLMARRVRRG